MSEVTILLPVILAESTLNTLKKYLKRTIWAQSKEIRAAMFCHLGVFIYPCGEVSKRGCLFESK